MPTDREKATNRSSIEADPGFPGAYGGLVARCRKSEHQSQEIVIRRRRKRVLQPGSRVDFNQIVLSGLLVAQYLDFADPEVVEAFNRSSAELLDTFVHAHLDARAGLTQFCRGSDSCAL